MNQFLPCFHQSNHQKRCAVMQHSLCNLINFTELLFHVLMVHCISYYHRIKPTIRIPTTSGLAGYDKIQPAYWTPESDICSNISLQICVRFALGVDVYHVIWGSVWWHSRLSLISGAEKTFYRKTETEANDQIVLYTLWS